MKIYQTRLGNLSTSVDVNGVLRRVQFLASDGVNGIFSTADEQLQRAMEIVGGMGDDSNCRTSHNRHRKRKFIR